MDYDYTAKQKHLLDLIKLALRYSEDNDLDNAFLAKALVDQQKTVKLIKDAQEQNSR
jgi:hypothetical protein